MTVEQIQAIRDARAELEALKKRQEEELKAFTEHHWKTKLEPLVRACDHTYPWGESALRTDFGSSSMGNFCPICLSRRVYRD